MKTFFFVLSLITSLSLVSCKKANKCKCKRAFQFGNYYEPGDVVSNRGACWTMAPGTHGAYFNHPNGEPRDTFPITQDTWRKICAK